MNLYLLERPTQHWYDEYDSLVVCAESPAKARRIHPRSTEPALWKDKALDVWNGIEDRNGCWIDADKVLVKYIGKAASGMVPGVVVASYNAG